MNWKRLYKESWDMVRKDIRTGELKHLGQYTSRKMGVNYAPDVLDYALEMDCKCRDIDKRDDLIADFVQYQGKRAIQCGKYKFFLCRGCYDGAGYLKKDAVVEEPELADHDSLVRETSNEPWFDKYGNLTRMLPEECIADCSNSGRVDDAVDYWVDELDFTNSMPIDQAREYLAQFGAWERDELEEMTPREIAMKVLWVFCGYIKDERHEHQDDEDYEDWLPSLA